MLRFWDFECPKHGVWEVFLDTTPPDAVYCPEPGCGEVARRVWTHAPGVAGKEKGLYPRFDVQLGLQIQSKAHEARVLKERGLLKMGGEEWQRSINTTPAERENVLDENDRKMFIDCALKAYHDVDTRAIPLEHHPSVESVETKGTVLTDGKE